MTITPKLVALEIVLLGFLAFTGYAIIQYGYLGFFDQVLGSTVSMLLFTDLTICLSLAGLWMFFDARQRDLPVAPYLVVGLALGAAGPLMYLIHREMRSGSAAMATQASS